MFEFSDILFLCLQIEKWKVNFLTFDLEIPNQLRCQQKLQCLPMVQQVEIPDREDMVLS